MKKKIVVAGHIGLDITPVFQADKKRSVSQVFCPGKLIRTEHAIVHTGGVVSNTGLALQKMGANVRLAGKLGDDALGKLLFAMMQEHGMERDLVIDAEAATAYTIALAPPGIDRIFLHGAGANDTFVTSDLSDELLAGAAVVHFGYPPLMKRMYENDGEELCKLCARVHANGAALSLDMAAVDPDAAEGKADWHKILERVLPQVDFFVPSIEELCFMLDRARYDTWMARAGDADVTELLDLETDIRPIAEEAMALGAKILMLKCGARGIYYQTADAEKLAVIPPDTGLDVAAWAEKSGFQGSFPPKQVCSATGAGDTSIACFLYAMLEGYPPERCIALAAAQGASCVETFDALSGLHTLEELEQRLADGWQARTEKLESREKVTNVI